MSLEALIGQISGAGGRGGGVIRFTPWGDREGDPDATKYVTQRLTTSKNSKAPG